MRGSFCDAAPTLAPMFIFALALLASAQATPFPTPTTAASPKGVQVTPPHVVILPHVSTLLRDAVSTSDPPPSTPARDPVAARNLTMTHVYPSADTNLDSKVTIPDQPHPQIHPSASLLRIPPPFPSSLSCPLGLTPPSHIPPPHVTPHHTPHPSILPTPSTRTSGSIPPRVAPSASVSATRVSPASISSARAVGSRARTAPTA